MTIIPPSYVIGFSYCDINGFKCDVYVYFIGKLIMVKQSQLLHCYIATYTFKFIFGAWFWTLLSFTRLTKLLHFVTKKTKEQDVEIGIVSKCIFWNAGIHRFIITRTTTSRLITRAVFPCFFICSVPTRLCFRYRWLVRFHLFLDLLFFLLYISIYTYTP